MGIFGKLFGNSSKSNPQFNSSDFSKVSKSDFTSFEDLVDQHAGLSFEKQQNFSELTGNLAWNIDLNTGTLSFGDMSFPIEIIGSLSFNDYSWMWGWANSQSGIPENLLGESLKLKALGEKMNIEQFTTGHFNVDEGFEHQMGFVASGLIKSDAYFCANYGQGTMVVTLKSDKIPPGDSNKLERILTLFPQLIGGIDLNHKEAFKSYLIDRNLELNISENKIAGTKNGKLITAEFDDSNRLVSLKGEL